MRKIILNAVVCLIAINASSFAISAESSPSRDELNDVMKVHASEIAAVMEGANKRGNSSRLTQSFHFFMFEPIFSPVNALNQPI
ncbi:UNVERIFIED_CONTAM: hypothetical protein NQD88_18485 [Escherichia coli]|nr:hypothetical protein [Escherichia coli]